MVDPINYGALLTQVDLSPLQRGLQQRTYNRNQEAEAQQRQSTIQLAKAKFTAEQEQDKAYQAALASFAENPTPSSIADLSVRFPQHAEALAAGFKTYTGAQQRDIIGTTTNALAAIGAGKYDIAAKTIRDRSAALKRAGVDTTHTDAALALVESGDPVKQKQGAAFLAQVLSGAIGGDEASRIMKTFGYGAEADREAAKDARDERRLDQGERRIENSERATNAAIAGRARDDARADRKAASGGKKGGAKGAYSNADLDALLQ